MQNSISVLYFINQSKVSIIHMGDEATFNGINVSVNIINKAGSKAKDTNCST